MLTVIYVYWPLQVTPLQAVTRLVTIMSIDLTIFFFSILLLEHLFINKYPFLSTRNHWQPLEPFCLEGLEQLQLCFSRRLLTCLSEGKSTCRRPLGPQRIKYPPNNWSENKLPPSATKHVSHSRCRWTWSTEAWTIDSMQLIICNWSLTEISLMF